MSSAIVAAVLFAAFLHAAWNVLLKRGSDPLLDTTLLVLGTSVVVIPLLPFVDAPAREAWPYMLASTILHCGYYTALAGAYRFGDLSLAYPLMRGLAPLVTALIGIGFLGEFPPALVWLGIGLVCAGVLTIGLSRRLSATSRLAIGFALANVFIISGYTLVDGKGVRVAGSPAGYAVWLFFLEGLPFFFAVLWWKRRLVTDYVRARWRIGLLGGACSAGSYGIAMVAMAHAPVAAVAALRETSVVFGAAMGAWLLKEPFGRRRILGACAVAAGVALIK